MQKYFDNHKVKGLVIGLILSAILFIAAQNGGFNGLKKSTNIQFFTVLISAGFAAFAFANTKPKHYTFGNIFAHGFKTIGVAIIVVIAFLIVDHFLLHTNLQNEAFADFQSQLDNIPNTEFDNARKLEQLTVYKDKYLIMGRISPTLLLYCAIGALGALLGAAFSPKKD